ncbi:MAG: outer membrane lipoprotein-sorting protein [Pseudomonadota bacterium]
MPIISNPFLAKLAFNLLNISLLIVCFCFSLPVLAFNTGEELAAAVYNRDNGDNVFSIGTMKLIEKGHNPRVRQMLTFREDQKGKRTSSLIRFKKPADIKNTGLLTIDYDKESKDTDQWIYLPALDRPRRISSSRKGGHFVGSDIFYEDLRDRKVAKDTHKIIGKEKVNGLATIKLESIPLDFDDSAYSKKVSWINTKTLLAVKVEFYQNRESQPFKQTLVKKIKKIQGIWSIMDSIVTDLNTGHKTQLTVNSIYYNTQIPTDLFSKKYLADPSREKSIINAIISK